MEKMFPTIIKCRNPVSKKIILFVIALALLNGCSFKHELPNQPELVFPSQQKLDLQVGLFIPEQLKNYLFIWAPSDKYITSIGNMLERRVQAVAIAGFRKVSKSDSKSFPDDANYKALLIPTVLGDSVSIVGNWLYSRNITANLQLEWQLIASNGDPIWVQSVQGKIDSTIVRSFKLTKTLNKFLPPLIDDAMTKSLAAISSSQEIRLFIESQQ